MTIYELIAASGTVWDNDPDDFNLFLFLNVEGYAAQVHLHVAGEDNAYLGLFLPTDDAFVALARQLGYPFFDERGAGTFLKQLQDVEQYLDHDRGPRATLLDEILSAHWFKALSSSRVKIAFEDLQAAGYATSVAGRIVEIQGNTLVNGDPHFSNPTLLARDIPVSNGLLKPIDQVLLPFPLPELASHLFDHVVQAQDGIRKAIGTEANDLVLDTFGRNMLQGGNGADMFVLAGDKSRDKVIDFEPEQDTVNLTDWGIVNFAELAIRQRNDSSVLISAHGHSAVLQAATGEISPDDLSYDTFVYANAWGGDYIRGTSKRDRLEGTSGNDNLHGGAGRDFMTGGPGRDIFHVGVDTADVILDFTEGVDRIGIPLRGLERFSDLSVSQVSKSMLSVHADGFEVRVRAADGEINVNDLNDFDFLFFGG